MTFSNLDIVTQLNTFPDPATHSAHHSKRLSELTFFTDGSQTLGYVMPAVVSALSDPSLSGDWWMITSKTISISGATEHERSANIARTTAAWRAAKTFSIVAGWRDELYSVYTTDGALFLRVERSAAALFGVVMYGVHMTAYMREQAGMRIWVSRRAATKSTYPNMLDNTVAGGITSGMGVLKSMTKESREEAGLDGDFVRKTAKSAGAISYFYERSSKAGGETGLIQPEVQYCYDLELPEDVVPSPCDGEVQEELAAGNFKPNCAVVVIDFLIRHGIITPENEPDYLRIISTMHRNMEFPIAHQGSHEL